MSPSPSKPKSIEQICDIDAVVKLMEKNNIGSKSIAIDRNHMATTIKQKVVGQDEVVDALARGISIGLGKQQRKQPIFSALFAGPPGVGKTYLGKMLASYLSKRECGSSEANNLCMIEMAGMKNGQEAIHKLIGVGSAYKGSESGGVLTNKLSSGEKTGVPVVVLIDEVEKGDKEVLDILLSGINDGRITSGMGSTVSTTNAVFILTTNLATDEALKVNEGTTEPVARNAALKQVFSKHLRPEILDRMSSIFCFNPPRPTDRARMIVIEAAEIIKDQGFILNHADPNAIFSCLSASMGGSVRGAKQYLDDLLGGQCVDLKAVNPSIKLVDLVVEDGSVIIKEAKP